MEIKRFLCSEFRVVWNVLVNPPTKSSEGFSLPLGTFSLVEEA